MKRAIVVAAFLTAANLGCAHQTRHEYCVANAPRYRDYDQCMALADAEAEARRRDAAALFGNDPDRAQQPPPPSPTREHCVTRKDPFTGDLHTDCEQR